MPRRLQGDIVTRLLGLCVAALLCASCTVVQVTEGQTVRSHLGVLRIAPDAQTGLAAYRSAGIGVVPGINGATLGYRRENVVLAGAGAACRVVVFELPESREAAKVWRDILSAHPNICILKGEEDE
ncbi:MAG: hypothetical protein Q7J32_03210 [Sphingomonadaceae bacterium]|nr:hypothetical protein [Sphingomonadaceae bacterium]